MRIANRPLPTGKQLPMKNWAFEGFNLGEDTFSLPTELDTRALARMYNMEIYGKKSVRPRRGTRLLGSSIGSGSTVDGLFQFKQNNGGGDITNELIALVSGTLYKYNDGTEIFDTAISGATLTAGLLTRGTKLRGSLYLGNGTDKFTKYNGTSLVQYSAVSPPVDLAVGVQGTPGTTAYEYALTVVTGKGESTPTDNVATTTGAETLNTTDFNRLTFSRVTDSQVIGYNIYGRSTLGTGVTLLTYVEQPASGATVTFDDNGAYDQTTILPPDGDMTDGIKASIWGNLKGSLVAAGVEGEEDTFFYSGTGERYESFSPAHNGGWVVINPGANDKGITGMAPFEDKYIIAKERSIHQFYFDLTTGEAIVQELISYIGCGAPDSMIVVENDIFFLDSEKKLRVLGYEPNYFAAIRTTSLSEGRTQSNFDEVEDNYIQNSTAVYLNGAYRIAVTTTGSTYNNRVITYDRRYLAFTGVKEGSGCHVRCWAVWDGLDGKSRIFAGASDTNKVFEFGVEGKLDEYDGTAIHSYVRTRNEDLGNSGQTKLWNWVDVRLYRTQGNVYFQPVIDGENYLETRSFSSTARTGFGVKQFGTVMWGEQTGTPSTASDLDKTYRREIYETGGSIQYEIGKNDTITDFVLVSLRGRALILPGEVFNSANYI